MSTTDQSPKPKLHWLRYKLKTLLGVMLLSIAVGWIGFRMHRASRNRERPRTTDVEKAIAEIKMLGGRVAGDYEQRRPYTWPEKIFGDPGSPDDPAGVWHVTSVNFNGANVTDAGLEHLTGLKSLRSLNLWDESKITDAGLEHLRGLTKLQFLMVKGTSVTGAGVKKLKRELPDCIITR